ncbi:MAG: DUF547 domain-containing protein [Pseudomonadota bacterium]
MMKYVSAGVTAAFCLAASPAAGLAEEVVNASAVAAPIQEASQHQVWTDILQKYTVEGEDGLNRFDYGGLQANASDSAALDAYLATFADLDFDALDDDEAFVAWGNLYNALTVDHIVDRFPLNSIRSGYILPPFGPWKEVTINAGGREVSLDDIEHNILRAEWDEPRIHYMVNCASYGCPNLKSTAWEVETLEEDLVAAAKAYVNHPRGVTIRRNGTLQVSTIYKWFREDFGGNNEGVVAHLLEYAEPELAAQIRANPRITKHEYDWALNGVE